MSKTRAKLQAELEAIEERKRAIETEMAMADDSESESKIVRREFFDQMGPSERMGFIQQGGRVTDA